MLVSCRTTRILLQAVERHGIAPSRLTEPLGLALEPLMDPAGAVSWETITLLHGVLADIVGDGEGLQAIGRSMTYVPAYEPLRLVAKSALTVQQMYSLAERWVAPANFPHVHLFLKASPGRRLVAHGTIPARYAASEPFFQIVIGTMVEMPVLMGLPPARIVEQRVSSRSFDLELELPEHDPGLARFVRGLRAFVHRDRTLRALEEQRRALARGFETVQRARDELRAILEHLPDLVFMHDAGRIVFANRSLVELLGWTSSGDLVGRPVADLVERASLDLVTSPGLDAHAPGEALAQARFRTRTGESVLVELAPVRSVVFGASHALLVVGRDLRERERLHQRLAAADRLASVGVLAAGVAHEINNPLAYVLNNIELARSQARADSALAVDEALGIALEGVERIRTIVRELLKLARGDGTAVGPTDLEPVIESTLALARVEIERVATLTRSYDHVPTVRASTARVTQILLNLVLNALEAMRGRPVAENELAVRLRLDRGGRVAVEIADNGPGIAPENIVRLFEPFYTTKPDGVGTGLGLPITQRMVVELGGEILVDSELGRGTTVRVMLPVDTGDRPLVVR